MSDLQHLPVLPDKKDYGIALYGAGGIVVGTKF